MSVLFDVLANLPSLEELDKATATFIANLALSEARQLAREVGDTGRMSEGTNDIWARSMNPEDIIETLEEYVRHIASRSDAGGRNSGLENSSGESSRQGALMGARNSSRVFQTLRDFFKSPTTTANQDQSLAQVKRITLSIAVIRNVENASVELNIAICAVPSGRRASKCLLSGDAARILTCRCQYLGRNYRRPAGRPEIPPEVVNAPPALASFRIPMPSPRWPDPPPSSSSGSSSPRSLSRTSSLYGTPPQTPPINAITFQDEEIARELQRIWDLEIITMDILWNPEILRDMDLETAKAVVNLALEEARQLGDEDIIRVLEHTLGTVTRRSSVKIENGESSTAATQRTKAKGHKNGESSATGAQRAQSQGGNENADQVAKDRRRGK
ncbi:hypothetical protein EG329_004820, partial [Mollisiaceae sp. DMI_Dod_QoI]